MIDDYENGKYQEFNSVQQAQKGNYVDVEKLSKSGGLTSVDFDLKKQADEIKESVREAERAEEHKRIRKELEHAENFSRDEAKVLTTILLQNHCDAVFESLKAFHENIDKAAVMSGHQETSRWELHEKSYSRLIKDLLEDIEGLKDFHKEFIKLISF